MGVVGLVGGGYAVMYEPHRLEVIHHRLQVASLRSRIKVTQLSDLHVTGSFSLSQTRNAVSAALKSEPDFFALTGDFVTGKMGLSDEYGESLTLLTRAAPTFACLGNHDGGPWTSLYGGWGSPQRVMDFLARSGVHVLVDSRHQLRIGQNSISLIGIADIWNTTPVFPKDQSGDRRADLTVVLSHNPDSKEFIKNESWDVLLSGHTHGGQLIVPFTGWRPFLPVMDRRIVDGLYDWEKRKILVSRGVGTLHGARINCPPDIRIIDFVPAGTPA